MLNLDLEHPLNVLRSNAENPVRALHPKVALRLPLDLAEALYHAQLTGGYQNDLMTLLYPAIPPVGMSTTPTPEQPRGIVEGQEGPPAGDAHPAASLGPIDQLASRLFCHRTLPRVPSRDPQSRRI